MLQQTALWIATVTTEAVFTGILVYRRAWRTKPLFSSYIAWSLFVDITIYAAFNLSQSAYARFYTAQTVLDSAMQFCVLVELAVCALRPKGATVSHRAILWIALAIFLVGGAIWPLVRVSHLTELPSMLRIVAHLQQTVVVLRILLFLLLALCSQWLAISWHDRELQIATGLGVFSLISLAVSIAQAQQTSWVAYGILAEFVSAAYICTLLYWIVSFLRQEAERKELSPRARQALQIVAGNARVGREVALSNLQKKND